MVHIELGIPGRGDLIVSHEPERLQRRFHGPDLKNAIHKAFRVAERQLLELKDQRHGRTKEGYHDDVNQYLGQVAEMHAGDGPGFLLTKEGGLLYFHRNSLLTGDFDRLKTGDEVRYVEDVGDAKPIATRRRVKAS